ncbi:MAG: DMT family transporter [Fibrobacteraceae bacterium]
MTWIFIKLHLSVLLAGCTGLFGKWVSLDAALLVWYRLVLAALMCAGLLACLKKIRKVSFKNFLQIGTVGAILSIHWLFFYGSIHASNVSIGVVSFSTTGFFTAILEPLINKHRFSTKEILLSLITIAGVFLIFSFDVRYRLGILLGLGAAALAALFTITNKKVGKNFPLSTMLLYELIGGAICSSLFLPVYLCIFPQTAVIPELSDFLKLLLFAFACTVILQIMQIQALKSLSAFTVNLTYNLEPIYSIILAMLFFGEARELGWSFYAGLSLILLSVLFQTLRVVHERKRRQ